MVNRRLLTSRTCASVFHKMTSKHSRKLVCKKKQNNCLKKLFREHKVKTNNFLVPNETRIEDIKELECMSASTRVCLTLVFSLIRHLRHALVRTLHVSIRMPPPEPISHPLIDIWIL
jgi:hypothetical protein